MSQELPAANTAVARPAGLDRLDKVAVLAAFAVVFGASWGMQARMNPLLLTERMSSMWFEADLWRVYANLTDRQSNHYRLAVHPLFSLALHPLAHFLEDGLRLARPQAVWTLVAGAAGLCAAGLFLVLRQIGCRRLDGLLFTALWAVSSAGLFWMVVPETYLFGAASILWAFLLLARALRRPVAERWFVLCGLATAGMTVTNWLAGLAAAGAALSWWRALRVALLTVGLLLPLMALQSRLFYGAPRLPVSTEEFDFMFVARPATVVQAFFFHGVLMPELTEATIQKLPGARKLSVQAARLGSASKWGVVGTVAWLGLLGLGGVGLWAGPAPLRFRAVLGLCLAGQLGLHLLYGDETFLYACHYAPLLVLAAALSSLTRWRPWARAAVIVLIPCAAMNNALQLGAALQWVDQFAR